MLTYQVEVMVDNVLTWHFIVKKVVSKELPTEEAKSPKKDPKKAAKKVIEKESSNVAKKKSITRTTTNESV